jgi:enoyl-CoA hydratase/carnithine racemase
MITDTAVLTERRGNVLVITLNRPDARNAVDAALAEGLGRAIDELDSDEALAVGVLTGAGKAFSSGMDLKAFVSGERPYYGDRGFAGIVQRPSLKPLIAAVEGFALAGGCELAILSDFVVAGETAVFGVPETTLGIFPGIGGTQLLPRILGAPLAKELIFTGRRMKAEEAKAAGLVNHLVPAGQAKARATEIATTIARNGPIAVRQAKKAIAYGSETDLETAMILAIEAYNATVVTEDRLEGVRAFNEKRRPQFKGR